MSGAIRLGLAGIGRAGWNMHVPELASRGDKFTFVAACDPLPERRRLMADRFGCAVYETFEEMLRHPDVEMVDIATPSHWHARHAHAALDAGKAVFAEKPYAVAIRDAEALAERDRRAPGRYFVRHNARFNPLFTHVRQIMASGVLGTVHTVQLRRQQYQRRNDWQTLQSHGGGQMFNTTPHYVDHLLLLLESPVADQWSWLSRQVSAGDAEDCVRIMLRGVNGRLADLEVATAVSLPEKPYRVSGTLGSLSADDQTITLRYLDASRLPPAPPLMRETPPLAGGFGGSEDLPWIEETVPVGPTPPVALDQIWDALHAAFREGVPYPVPMAHALEIMRVFDRARRQNPAYAQTEYAS